VGKERSMIRLLIGIGLLTVGCTTPQDWAVNDFGMDMEEPWMGEGATSIANGRLVGTIEELAFEGDARVEMWKSDYYTDLIITTNETHPVGMLMVGSEGDMAPYFDEPGTYSFNFGDAVYTQLCGGEEDDIDYDESADRTDLRVYDDEDGVRMVEITGRVAGEGRYQSASFPAASLVTASPSPRTVTRPVGPRPALCAPAPRSTCPSTRCPWRALPARP
jgi:hypothetical protein